ncbi:lipopolysaccharide export system protein LptA [Azomonas agilis]|uniref:Lipopolysaccharide export system protein LptA n=1 Tax=Azomonas agilis TaxID=116849 RepID=A0A562J0E6_9GAMM|nr:lipopolysaccharide transport periplasmic protein LptA [Azomonas agilis]TWH76749.1 lipopolysaccharide export system protein LptA [Azomonas agilis]
MSFANRLILLALLSLSCTSQVLALPEDRNQPIHVQADSAELDDRNGIAVYRGNVIITQGTMKVTGHTVTITRTPSGELNVFTALGTPAYYEQKPAVNKSIVQAYALTLQYFVANNRIVLIDQAKIVQEGSTFQGEKIVYDTQRQIVNAGRAGNTPVTAPRPRIDMVIQPKSSSPQGQTP